MTIVTSVAVIAGLTFTLASIIVIANRWLHVQEYLRIDRVELTLPHTHCGAFGYPGCQAFAEALMQDATLPAKYTAGTKVDHVKIATFLGVDIGTQEKRVARLACADGSNVARNRAHTEGLGSRAAAALVAGGGGKTSWKDS